jgi:hypothetical protein
MGAGVNSGHRAAYALAIAEAQMPLFKGTAFGSMDVEMVGRKLRDFSCHLPYFLTNL